MRLWYFGLLALATPLYWPRLMRSFWVDEAGTFWMAHAGLWAAIERCANWPGQSILYGALASLFCIEAGPWREAVLRIPSVAGLGLTLYFTTRLARNAMGEAAGVCAFGVLLFHSQCYDLFLQARPYGLAAGAVAASYCYLYEWVKTRERSRLVGWGAATLVIFYLHYLYVGALLGQGLYLLYEFYRERRRERWRELFAVVGAIGALVVPLAAHLRLLTREAESLSYVAKPDIVDLATTLIPGPIAWAAAGAGVVVLAVVIARGWRLGRGQRPSVSFVLLAGGWWVLGTMLLFSVSRVGNLQVFVSRYLGFSAPGDALVLGCLGAWLFGERVSLGWVLAAAAISTGGVGGIRRDWGIGYSEARPAMELVRAEAPAPLLFQSSLVESNARDWRSGTAGSYLFSELVAYPVPNSVYPLPIRAELDIQYHVMGLLDSELKTAPVIVYSRFGDLPGWLRAQMAQRGYQVEARRVNAYVVAVFRK